MTSMTNQILLSPSQINMFLRCQYQWYLRYVEGHKVPPKVEMLVGSAFHKSMEENFRQKIETKEDLPLQDVLDIYDTAFNERLEEIEDKPEDKVLGGLKDSGYLITKEYMEKQAIKVHPLEVETHIETQITENIRLQGYADVITEDLTVIDLKTTKKKPNEIGFDYQLQLETYAINGDIRKAEIHYAIQTKTPQILVLEHHIPLTSRVKTIAKQVAEAIKTGNFLPTGLAHSWACSYCGYKEKDLCPYNK